MLVALLIAVQLTIDFVITNVSSKFIIYPFMLDTYISDHKTICIDLDLPKPTVHNKSFFLMMNVNLERKIKSEEERAKKKKENERSKERKKSEEKKKIEKEREKK